MTNYLFEFGGQLDDSFPWSCSIKGTSADSEASAAAAFDVAVKAMWNYTALADFIPAGTTLTFTSCSTASAVWKQTTKTTTASSIAGLDTHASLAYHTACIVTWRTALATRYGRGRIYMPAMGEDALSTAGYFMSSAALAAMEGAWNSFFASLAGAITLVVLHRKGGGSGTVAPLSFDPVTGADCSDQFAQQRRRADKRLPTRATITV